MKPTEKAAGLGISFQGVSVYKGDFNPKKCQRTQKITQ